MTPRDLCRPTFVGPTVVDEGKGWGGGGSTTTDFTKVLTRPSEFMRVYTLEA